MMPENIEKPKDSKSRIPTWCVILFLVGIIFLALGMVISNTAHINFPEDDFKDHRDEEDISAMQFLIGAVFINFGVGLVLISLFIGFVANDTIETKPRVLLLMVTSVILFTWIYFTMLSGLISKLTWIHP